MKRWSVVLLAVVVIAVAAGLAASSRGKPSPASEPAPAGAEVSTVGALSGRADSPGIAARALGKVESASEIIGVASDITGRIAEILVEEGQVVEKGAPLAKLEPFVYESRVSAAKAAVAQALARKKLLEAGARSEEIDVARALLEESRASERLARKNWQRVEQLIVAGVVSNNEADAAREEVQGVEARVKAANEKLTWALHQTRREELEAAEAELEQRRHELAVAEAELEKTVLRAPIAGTIIRRSLRVGEAVSSFQVAPVVTIADMKRLRVRAEVDEIDLGLVHLGQAAELELLSLPGKPRTGKVIRIGKSMGRKKVESNDPNEREDVRVLEVLLELEGAEELPLGLRMMVSFER